MEEQMLELMDTKFMKEWSTFFTHEFLQDKVVLIVLGAILLVISGILLNKKGWYLIHLSLLLAGTLSWYVAYHNAEQAAYNKGRSEALEIIEAHTHKQKTANYEID